VRAWPGLSGRVEGRGSSGLGIRSDGQQLGCAVSELARSQRVGRPFPRRGVAMYAACVQVQGAMCLLQGVRRLDQAVPILLTSCRYPIEWKFL